MSLKKPSFIYNFILNKSAKTKITLYGILGLLIILSIFIIFYIVPFVSAGVTNISDCSVLNIEGETYRLIGSITISTSKNKCFDITAENVTLDLNGPTVNIYFASSVVVKKMVYSNKFNTTIQEFSTISFSGGSYLFSAINLVAGASNSTIIDNQIKTVGGMNYLALNISDADYLTIFRNNITGWVDNAGANNGSIFINSNNNNITQNNFRNSRENAIQLKNSSKNIFYYNNITTNGDLENDGAIIINRSSNNLFWNGKFGTNQAKIIKFIGTSTNNTFLNITYSKKENVASGGQLIRKWYFDAQVNYKHNSSVVNGATVAAYNTTGNLQFSTLTNSSGRITRKFLIQYINTSTTSYYTNYTINVTLSGWNTNSSKVNITGNLLKQIKISDTAPSLTIRSPLNQSYATATILFNVTATDSLAVSICRYSFTGGAKNYSLTRYLTSTSWNATNSTMAQGHKTVTYYCNDTADNWGAASRQFTIDSINPSVTSLAEPTDPATYAYGRSYKFNATVTDAHLSVVKLEFNSVNHTASNVGGNTYGFTLNSLSVGGPYSYRWYANDTFGNSNNTQTGTYTVNKASPSSNMAITGTTPITYLTTSAFTSSETNNGDGSCSYSTSRTNKVYGVGTWTFNYSTAGCTNYSAGSVTKDLVVSKAIPAADFTNNKAWTREYDGTNNTIGISESNTGDTDVTYVMFRGGVSQGASDSWGSIGTYTYKINTTGGGNYSDVFNLNTNTLTVQDTTKPKPKIVYPLNATYSTNVSTLTYTYTELLPSRCWYSKNNGATNSTSVACGTNFSNIVSTEGTNKWILYMNDTTGNENSTSKTFFKDTIYPKISMVSPANNTNSSNTELDIKYKYTEINCRNVTWNENSGANTTLASCGTNVTIPTWGQGKHNFTIFIRDIGNNLNKTYVSFKIDTTLPVVTIASPTNNTITKDTTLDIKYTYVEAGTGCKNVTWQDGTGTNTTLASCGTNITTPTWGQGKHNVTVFMRDWSNNLGKKSVSFRIDTTKPTITITNPTNSSYATTTIPFNVTATDNIGMSSCRYSFNTGTKNYTMTNNSATTWGNKNSTMTQGHKTVTFYCNDTSDNINSTSRQFTVDNVYPKISMVSPANNTNSSDAGLDVKYKYTEINCHNVTWQDGTGTNTTLASCGTNVTIPTWGQGKHNVTVFIRDWSNQLNKTYVSFRTDTTNPAAALITPSNNTKTSDTTLNLTASLSDNQGIKNATLKIYNSTNNLINTTTINYGSNVMSKTLGIFHTFTDGVYKWFQKVFDWAGNSGVSSNYTLTVDTNVPLITINSPLNKSYATTTIQFNVTATDVSGMSSCRYSFNTGTKNYTMTNNSATTWGATNSTMVQGHKTVTYYCNDTSDNIGNTQRAFFVDTIYPKISMVSPSNNTNSSNAGLDIKYKYTEINCANTTWQDGTGSNTTLASCGTNVTIPTWGQGKHNITIFIRDVANNLNKTYVSFRIDSINPQIAYDTETAADYANLSQNSVYVNVTLTETNFKNITYTLRNKTATLNTTIFTTARKYLNFTKGIRDDNYTYFVNVSDTTSNKNSTAIRHLTLDTINPNMTIYTANNTATASGSLTISINFTATDTSRKKCYFSLRTPGGLLHNYAENTSMSCTTTPKAITTLYYGKFIVQFWAEDYTGNLGDANLTFTTTASGGGGGGGGGGPPISPVEEKPEVTKTFCGDNVCQSTGNDYGIKEDYYSCQIDCPGFNFDALIFSFTKYCWDKDPSTICIFGTLFGVENAEIYGNQTNQTIYKDGQVCKGDVCENLGGKTLTYNCFVGKPCFFASGTGAITAFITFFSFVAISFVKVGNPQNKGRGKVNPYSYIAIKLRRGRRR